MPATEDWTPLIGWRKAIVRIALGAAVAMGLSLGGAFLVRWLFGQVDRAGGGGLGYVPWPIWVFTSVLAGFLGGMAVSWKLVENSSVVGGPAVASAAAALILAHLGTFKLAAIFLGPRWEQFLFLFVIAEGMSAVLAAGWRILVDS